MEKKPIENERMSLLLEKFSIINLKVIGNSMEPFLYPDDIVEIIKGEPKSGSIAIIPNQKGDIIIHRVCFSFQDLLITRGDNSLFFEISQKKKCIGIVINRFDIALNRKKIINLGYLYQIEVLLIIVNWRFYRRLSKFLKRPKLYYEEMYENYKNKLVLINKRWEKRKSAEVKR